MKRILIFFLLYTTLGYAQQFDVAFSKKYPERMFLLDSIVREDIKSKIDTDTSFYLSKVNELKSIAQKEGDKKATFYSEYLYFYYQLSVHPPEEKEVIKKFEELRDRAKDLKMVQIQSNLYNDLGYYYYKRSNPNYILYFDNLNKAYDLYKNMNVKEYPDKAYNLYSLALSYYQFGDYTDAITFAKQIEPLKDGDNFVDLFTYNLLGMAFLKLNLFDSSRIYLQKANDLANSFPKEKGLGWTGITQGNIGHAWYKEGKYEKAIPNYLQAIEICNQTKLWDNVSPFTARLISSYVKIGKPEEAEKFLQLARGSTFLYNQADGYALFYNALADYYKAKGEGMQAIVYRDSAIFYNDSLQRTFDRNLKVQVQLSNYKEKVSAQEALYKSEKLRQIIIRYGIIGFVILILIGSYVLYNRQKKLLQNKTVLLKEIHHRVKNNLQLISSILDIQQRSLNDATLMQAFVDAKSRINSMALVHQNLYEKENIGIIDTREYFDQLFRIITSSYAQKNIKITHSIHADARLTIDTLIPMALIFNELLTNTYKYAFTNRSEGNIYLEITQKDEDIQMIYSDNGQGFPDGYEWSKSKGLGSLMIRKFTQQLFGTYSVNTTTAGVKFMFNFKSAK